MLIKILLWNTILRSSAKAREIRRTAELTRTPLRKMQEKFACLPNQSVDYAKLYAKEQIAISEKVWAEMAKQVNESLRRPSNVQTASSPVGGGRR